MGTTRDEVARLRNSLTEKCVNCMTSIDLFRQKIILFSCFFVKDVFGLYHLAPPEPPTQSGKAAAAAGISFLSFFPGHLFGLVAAGHCRTILEPSVVYTFPRFFP